MLDWFLKTFFVGDMKASDFQSIAQLTVAVSLTYVVAGPDVSRLLRSSFIKFKNLHSSLKVLHASGIPSLHAVERQKLLTSAYKFINADAARTAPSNASTTRFYAIAAAISFLMLVYCTFGANLNRTFGVIFTVAAVVVITRDACVAAMRARVLQALADEVHRIARNHNMSLSPAQSLSNLTRASGVIARLEIQTVDLKNAIKELKGI